MNYTMIKTKKKNIYATFYNLVDFLTDNMS